MSTTLTELFIRECQYLKNVTKATVQWYVTAFKCFEDCGLDQLRDLPPSEILSNVRTRVMDLQAKGTVKPISINTWLLAINTYLRWGHEEGHLGVLLKVAKLKAAEAIIEPWSSEQIHKLVSYKPKQFAKRRVHGLALLIADTGLRLSEALSLTRSDVDLNSMLVTVRCGKGGKARVVPMSVVGRKVTFKWLTCHEHDLIFCTRDGLPWTKRNALRSFKLLCEELGIKGVRTSWHTLRHSFAASFIREGGDVFSLQRMLGHSTLEMTRRYVRLNTADLQAKHQLHARLLRGR